LNNENSDDKPEKGYPIFRQSPDLSIRNGDFTIKLVFSLKWGWTTRNKTTIATKLRAP
jgi:hypothetical protein